MRPVDVVINDLLPTLTRTELADLSWAILGEWQAKCEEAGRQAEEEGVMAFIDGTELLPDNYAKMHAKREKILRDRYNQRE